MKDEEFLWCLHCNRVYQKKEIIVDVDSCEKYLIEHFFEFPNCDNDQIGGGEMTESEWYFVYIVYNT